jgi:dihydrofolate reductase
MTVHFATVNEPSFIISAPDRAGDPMRNVRYSVAASLDGYIAGPNGEYDWIIMDPEIDFAARFAKVDTMLLGRRTYEIAGGGGGGGGMSKMRVYVFSRTLRQADHPTVTIVADDAAATVAALRAEPGDGEIWLMGGGILFRDLLAAGQVDTVEVTIVPVILGGGIPLIPPGGPRASLTLTHLHRYEKTGLVSLDYAVQPPKAGKSRQAKSATRSRRTAAESRS